MAFFALVRYRQKIGIVRYTEVEGKQQMKNAVSRVLLGVLAGGFPFTLITGCRENPPDYQTLPPKSTASTPRPVGNIKPADPGKVVEGSALNKIFPPSGGGYKVAYTQEKKGFAQAEVTQGGKKLATISISDALANPDAKGKFAATAGAIDGYPSATVGNNGTAILVGDRFQVQVRSQTAALDAAGREAWIQKFNLDALKRLAGG